MRSTTIEAIDCEYLYLDTIGHSSVRRAVICVDRSLVVKVEEMTAALMTLQSQMDVVSLSAKASGVVWGYITTDDWLDLTHRRTRVVENSRRAFYASTKCIHEERLSGDPLLTVTAEGAIWQNGSTRTHIPVSSSLLRRIAKMPPA